MASKKKAPYCEADPSQEQKSGIWECNSVGRVLQREGILLLNALGRGFEPHRSHFLTHVPRVQGVFEGVYKM